MRLISLSWMLSVSLLLLNCAGTETIPEFHLSITRPANQDGMRVNVITGEYYIIPKEEWQRRVRKVVVLEREDWEIVKKHMYGVCIMQKCDRSLDLVSGLFEKIDEAVGKLPGAN